MSRLPIIEELAPCPDAEAVFARLSRHRGCLWLDSAMVDPVLGRYSFLAVDPFQTLSLGADRRGAIEALAASLAEFRTDRVADLPPFQGGAAGLFSYDLGRQFEIVPSPAFDEFGVPALAVGLYDAVIAWDHVASRAWIVSQGFPETSPELRLARAARRVEQLRGWLREAPCDGAGRLESAGARKASDRGPVAAPALAPQHPVGPLPELTSNLSESEYLQAVERAIRYVYAGDVFQVNLAQRLLHPARMSSVELFLRLRRANPAPFAGYFDLGEFQVVSASPERFVQVREGRVESRPIKGTRRRDDRPEVDRQTGAELLASEKDRAENVMIVDLLRNDLSRVCRPESVQVSQLCGLETYRYVQHLVSAICGEFREGLGPLDLVRASFPGGSVTGAPKIRAMEIIAELEPTARGAYCGCLGYVGFDGSMDLNILIRTITAGRGWWQAPVGGGIVAQSDPRREYQETWDKAEGLLRAMP
jgi:para-aminobenzoate synthetase component 1